MVTLVNCLNIKIYLIGKGNGSREIEYKPV